jgi:hypothetical protein
MKKFSRNILLVLCTIAVIFFGFSCDEDNTGGGGDNGGGNPSTGNVTPAQAVEALSEYAKVCKLFSDTFKESGEQVNNADLGISKNYSDNSSKAYPVVTVTPGTTAGTWDVEINYGTTNILCADSYYRRGKILVHTDGFFRNAGTNMIVTFNNYYQDEYKIDGTQFIKNDGPDPSDPTLTNYTASVVGGEITMPLTNAVIHYTETTLRQLKPNSVLCENIWYISGTWNGISSASVPYTLNAQPSVTNRLDYRVCCKYFRYGILDVNVQGLPNFQIDFGAPQNDTICDNKALISIPNFTPTIIYM